MWIEYNRFALSDGGRYALNVKNDGALIATTTKNCRVEKGVIRTGVGADYIRSPQGKTFRVPSTAKAVVTLRGDVTQDGVDVECAYVSSDGYLYRYSKADSAFVKVNTAAIGFVELVKDSGDSLGNRYFAICKNGFCLCDRNGKVYERVVSINGTGCVFNNRFFYAAGNAVCYSDVDGYTSNNESLYGAGKIELGGDGGIQKLIAYNDCVLVFMPDGIWEFHAKGAADEFFVKRIEYYGDKIVGPSVARCGNAILFVTSTGDLFRLQGNSCQKIAENIPEKFYSGGVSAAGNGALYFLSASDGKVLVADSNGELYFTSFNFYAVTPCDGRAMGVYVGFLSEIHEKYALSYEHTCAFRVENWLAKENAERVLEKIRLYGSGEAMVVVQHGEFSCAHTVQLKDVGVEIPVGVRGKCFHIELKLYQRTKVWKIEALCRDLGGKK